MARRSLFDQLFREIREIRYRLDDIESTFSNWNPSPSEISTSELFLLPDHLRKTYIAVATKGECNATRASNLTARCRAVESNHLNQLTRMGWLTKRRESKTIYYRLVPNNVSKETAMGKAIEQARLAS
jgi:DNA-binding transcriptional ArsR family regulator